MYLIVYQSFVKMLLSNLLTVVCRPLSIIRKGLPGKFKYSDVPSPWLVSTPTNQPK